MKKFISSLITFLLVLSLSGVFVSAKQIEPKDWQLAYFNFLKETRDAGAGLFTFLDLNQDGIPEIMTYSWYEYYYDQKFYTYIENRIHEFTYTGTNAVALLDGYRNKKTGEIKWFSEYDLEYYHLVVELPFDFENYTYDVKIIFQHNARGANSDGKESWKVGGKQVPNQNGNMRKPTRHGKTPMSL